MSSQYRLHAAPLTRTAQRWWRTTDPAASAREVLEHVIGIGQLLPLVRFADARVFPVVTFDPHALWTRRHQAPAALLDPATVRDVLTSPGHDQHTPSAVRMVAFIGIDPGASGNCALTSCQ